MKHKSRNDEKDKNTGALSFWQATKKEVKKVARMLQVLSGETCLLTSSFSDRQSCLTLRGREVTHEGMETGGGRVMKDCQGW